MQQRYYDPAIGRFLSVDPVPTNPTNGSSFNRYFYADNNPFLFTDPDGRNPCASSECFHEDAPPPPPPPTPPLPPAPQPPAAAPVQHDQVGRTIDAGLGLAQIGFGAAAIAGGLVEAVIASATIGDESASVPGGLMVTAGAIEAYDGFQRVQNAADGGNRATMFGQIGEAGFGPQGREVGDAASLVVGVNGAAKEASIALKEGSQAAAGRAATGTVGAARDLDTAQRNH